MITLPYCSHVFQKERSNRSDTINGISGKWTKVRYPRSKGPEVTGWVFDPYLSIEIPDLKLTTSGLKGFQAGKLQISKGHDQNTCTEIRFRPDHKFLMGFHCHSWVEGTWEITETGLKALITEGHAPCEHFDPKSQSCLDKQKVANVIYEFSLGKSGNWSFRRSPHSLAYKDDRISSTDWQELGQMYCFSEFD